MSSPTFIAYGKHVCVDISDAEPNLLNDLEGLERALVAAAIAEGVSVLGTLRKAFEPTGVTILLLLAESHVSLHTYPEQGRAFFDAFTCGVNYEPSNIFKAFADRTLPGQYKIIHLDRGSDPYLSA